ncbi:Protein twisted gastrulation [Frankliniella fusca]|uniref:Protein twisted gastrulation n=1 Tax=Frankliniella fusca TaxID=407009 RepID=A0AAE1HEI5_9NEOP|nr:Protein twisted gastrulation [Frankliniella fusca]
MLWKSGLVVTFFILWMGVDDLWGPNSVDSCNEAVCASIVSKCMLTQSCKCDLKNCSCCKECFSCLSYLYTECCSCVEMCPKPNQTNNNALSKRSHVEEFNEPIPELFQALMGSEPDAQERWITVTFPIDFELNNAHYKPNLEKEIKYRTQFSEQEVVPRKDVATLNCTVAYMSQCMSWNKCKEACQSTGASSYRWFHDGCCECVGATCINYGINESRCLRCPLEKDSLIPEEDPDSLIYDDVDYDEPTSAAVASMTSQSSGVLGTQSP